jgi:hypothetical protein
MARYLSLALALATVVPVAGYLLNAAMPAFPTPGVAVLLFLCPSFAWFGATAACEHFDRCSLSMLGWVVSANALLYCGLAAVLWLTRARFKAARFIVVGTAALASAWWAKLWVV